MRPCVHHAGRESRPTKYPGPMGGLQIHRERLGEHEPRRNTWNLEPNP